MAQLRRDVLRPGEVEGAWLLRALRGGTRPLSRGSWAALDAVESAARANLRGDELAQVLAEIEQHRARGRQ